MDIRHQSELRVYETKDIFQREITKWLESYEKGGHVDVFTAYSIIKSLDTTASELYHKSELVFNNNKQGE